MNIRLRFRIKYNYNTYNGMILIKQLQDDIRLKKSGVSISKSRHNLMPARFKK